MAQLAEQRRRYFEELRRQQRLAEQQRPAGGYYGGSQYGYGQQMYGAPAGSPYYRGYGNSPFGGGYGGFGGRQRYGNGGFGGNNIAMPLIGGLAGGLLLGDLFDGGGFW
jgi:hypothetical protein